MSSTRWHTVIKCCVLTHPLDIFWYLILLPTPIPPPTTPTPTPPPPPPPTITTTVATLFVPCWLLVVPLKALILLVTRMALICQIGCRMEVRDTFTVFLARVLLFARLVIPFATSSPPTSPFPLSPCQKRVYRFPSWRPLRVFLSSERSIYQPSPNFRSNWSFYFVRETVFY